MRISPSPLISVPPVRVNAILVFVRPLCKVILVIISDTESTVSENVSKNSPVFKLNTNSLNVGLVVSGMNNVTERERGDT